MSRRRKCRTPHNPRWRKTGFSFAGNSPKKPYTEQTLSEFRRKDGAWQRLFAGGRSDSGRMCPDALTQSLFFMLKWGEGYITQARNRLKGEARWRCCFHQKYYIK